MRYNHKKIEKKWQKYWRDNNFYEAEDNSKKPKWYGLVEFPYPSGDGLHVGHVRSHVAIDILARKKRMEGYNVLYPIGWDAFGLPTENFAIKTKQKPQVVTEKNIKRFREQIQSYGVSFDWSREVNTTDPAYHKWTQWIFLKLFEKGLAYKEKMPINWCPSCKIGLANEEVVAGSCERCGESVIKKEKEQWMLKITQYADRLIDDLDTVDYLPKIKTQQVNWIGRSEGTEIDFQVKNAGSKVQSVADFREKISLHAKITIKGQEFTIREIVKFRLNDGSFYMKLFLSDGYVLADDLNENSFILVQEKKISLEPNKESVQLEGKDFKFLYKAHAVAEEVWGEEIFKKGDSESFWDYMADDGDYLSLGILDESQKRMDLQGEIISCENVELSVSKEVLFASNNASKKARAEKILQAAGIDMVLKTPKELGLEGVDVEENGTLEENARAKALAYRDKTDLPILANDTSLVLDGEELDPVKVKRNALAGVDEATLTQKEVFHKMRDFYQKIAKKHGGEVEGYWYEKWVCIYPDGSERVESAKRGMTLTDTIQGEDDLYFPIRQLYKLKATGQYALLQTEEEELRECEPITKALTKLLTDTITVFTTRVDTIYGCTYCVIAPEHALIAKYREKITNISEIESYQETVRKKSDLERTELNKDKTGVKVEGIELIHPFTGEKLPLYVADYVIGSYGTGAVMAVPGHDERDFEFTKKYDLEVKQSIAPYIKVEGDNAPRSEENIHKFHAVSAIIKHWEEEKYLFVRFDKGLWGLIGGSVEDHDNHFDQAILLEAEEETVFKNFKIVDTIFTQAYSRGYKTRKSREEECNEIVYTLQILNDERSAEIAEEEGIKEWAWLTPKEALEKKLLTHHRLYFEQYLKDNKAFGDDGVLTQSGDFSGLTSEEAREKMTAWLEENGKGREKKNYKLRDWVFSRQHYWGEPIPIVHCDTCGMVPLPESELPLTLPDVDAYEPTDTGESPLAAITSWVNTKCPKCNSEAKRETDTMPNWAGSSWYFLRYADPHNSEALASKKNLEYWTPVDLYNGGMEHTTLHLLYSRFWHKFLYDIGVVPTAEPYARRVSHGMILAYDGQKMSKSKGNVVNPDDVINEFGADSLRLYEMFMGPFAEAIPWSTEGVSGVRRFLEKIWKFKSKVQSEKSKVGNESVRLLHKTIKKVTEDIESMSFNTAIAQMMILANALEKEDVIDKTVYERFLVLLSPFAPHLAEEIWSELGHDTSITLEAWPQYDEAMTVDSETMLIIQVNGKVRDKIQVAADISEEDAKEKALTSEKVQKFTQGKEVKKIIYVKGKLVSIVV